MFNALGPDKLLTMGQMLEACKKAAQSDAAFTWADAEFLEKQGVHAWSDMPAWVPASGDTAGFAKISNARAVKAGLGFLPIADTAKATLEWFRTQPEARRANSEQESHPNARPKCSRHGRPGPASREFVPKATMDSPMIEASFFATGLVVNLNSRHS